MIWPGRVLKNVGRVLKTLGVSLKNVESDFLMEFAVELSLK